MQLLKLICSYISLHAVTWACMQFLELACSSMSLHAVPFFVWAAHKNFAVLVDRHFLLTSEMCFVLFWSFLVHLSKVHSIFPIHFKYFPASSALILNKGCSHKYDPSCNPNTLRLPGINRPVLGNEREKFEIWHSILICYIQNLSMSSLDPVRWHGSWTPMWCWGRGSHGSVTNVLIKHSPTSGGGGRTSLSVTWAIKF